MSGSLTAVTRYPAMTRSLHWIVALMVIAMIPIGNIMTVQGLSRPVQDTLFILHKNGGVILLLLVVLRIFWRVWRPGPPLPTHMPDWQKTAAKTAHWLLYGALIVMAVSGYVRVRAGGFPVEMLDALGLPGFVPRSDSLAETAKAIHATAKFLLVALVLAHVGAALKHLLARDGVFGRIWPPVGR
jgi:cytochrome b561